MEKNVLLRLMLINILFCFALTMFPQNYQNIIGKYIMQDDMDLTKIVERYSLELYSQNRFKYVSESVYYGPVEIGGYWHINNDTIVLNSEVKELEIEAFVNLDYSLDFYQFVCLDLIKGSTNWFRKSSSLNKFFFVTENNDTLIHRPDSTGCIKIDKSHKIIKFWGQNQYLSNEIFLPSDEYINCIRVKYSPYRQFNNEKWLLTDKNTIIPFDRKNNSQAEYYLERDNSWDNETPWREPINFEKRQIHHNCGIFNYQNR